MKRIGLGYDIHRLVRGRPLMLGGVRIAHTKGALGHSDGDVILHALTDALLGAVGAGDIGAYFSDQDSRWKGVSSALFITEAVKQVRRRRLAIANVDVVVLLEAPKLAPHRTAIRKSVARLLGLPESRVSIKAKTHEGLGPIGSQKALACYAIALLV